MKIRKSKSSNHKVGSEASISLDHLTYVVAKATYEAGNTINNSYKSHAGRMLQQGDGKVMATYRNNQRKLNLMQKEYGI